MTATWQQRKFFYLVLIGMFVLHCSVMVVQLRDHFKQTVYSPPTSIKVKLVQEALKEIASTHKKQIVQSEDSESTDRPKDAAFLSDKDRAFERQTMARNIEAFKKAALGDSSITQKADQQKTAQKKQALKDLKLADIGLEAGTPVLHEIARKMAAESIKGMNNGDPLSQGLSATNDYVEEVTLGDFTHLNTVEYKFYGFYHRIRQKLEQFWGKSIQEKAENIFRSGRRLPASENLITSLQVSLNAKGEIVSVKILGASGVKELDDAAIESFNQAGPFPNPPKDLLVNGTATIEWGFVVKS